MKIQEALQTIGLNEKETAVYIALLEIGRASAYGVALKSGLKKPTTYVILDELIKKGLVQKIPRVKKQLYVAKSPEEAFGIAEEKLQLAKQKLPELLALTKGESTKVSVAYFEGVEGVKQALTHGLKKEQGKELVGFYATDEGSEDLRKYFKGEWASLTKKLGITARGVVPEHPSLEYYRKVDKEYGRQIKIVPYENYSSSISLDTIGNIVRIGDYKNLQALVIENADVAKTVREIFEMVWKK